MHSSVQDSISYEALQWHTVISSAFQVQFTKPAIFEGQLIHQNFFVFTVFYSRRERKASVFLSDGGFNLIIKTIMSQGFL